MSTKITGQLWYTDGQDNSGVPDPAGNGDEAGVINSDGSTDTTLLQPPTFGSPPLATDPWYTGIAVDTAAGYYWVVDNATGPTTTDPHAQQLLEYKIGTNSLVASFQIATDPANEDFTNDVVVDAVNHKVYVSTWGDSSTVSGIKEYSYSPTTGIAAGSAGSFVVVGDSGSATDTANTIVSDINQMSLDTTNQRLYFVSDDGLNGLSNAVYVKDLVGGSVTQLTSSSQFPVGGANGATAISGVAVDAADGKVFFLTFVVGGGGAKLWSVNTTGANQTATQITLPGGTSLGNGSYYDSLSFDPVNRQLYINQQYTSGLDANSSGIVVAQLGAGGTSVSSIVTTIPETTLESGALGSYVPLATQFVSLPLPNFTAAGTAAVERGSAVNLLTSASTSTDASNGYYTGATIQITGGTFSSNESSSSDDHLSINGVTTSGLISGTNITVSYNSATETLSLSGYDTIAHYNTLFKEIEYNASGQNPTNYGANSTRTITWTILDGESNIPAGSQNSTTTTVAITAVHDGPTLGGDGNSVTYHFSNPPLTIDSGLTVSDPDSQNIVGATVKITSGLLTGDTLNFTNQSGITGSYDSASGVLTLSGTATLAQYQTALDSVGYSSSSSDPTAGGTDPTRTIHWQVDDGFGSNNLSNVASSTITDTACYLAGTRILTESGEVAVEDLCIGDLLVTASGSLRPIKWIGRRAYSARFARNNPDLLPIRFKAGSLAEAVPVKDLLVSPKHAMFLDGVLVPAEHLVNGATIVSERPGEDICYFHIELESHDVLIAEGAFSESFVDDDSRAMFQNAHEFHELYPEMRRTEALFCAPRVESGYALDRIRRRLAAHAGLAVAATMELGVLRGAVETCDGEVLSGWAENAAFPSAPVCLDVYVDGAFLSYAYADGERDDGGRRFSLRLPARLDPSRRREISVRRSADGMTLGSSLVLETSEAHYSAA